MYIEVTLVSGVHKCKAQAPFISGKRFYRDRKVHVWQKKVL